MDVGEFTRVVAGESATLDADEDGASNGRSQIRVLAGRTLSTAKPVHQWIVVPDDTDAADVRRLLYDRIGSSAELTTQALYAEAKRTGEPHRYAWCRISEGDDVDDDSGAAGTSGSVSDKVVRHLIDLNLEMVRVNQGLTSAYLETTVALVQQREGLVYQLAERRGADEAVEQIGEIADRDRQIDRAIGLAERALSQRKPQTVPEMVGMARKWFAERKEPLTEADKSALYELAEAMAAALGAAEQPDKGGDPPAGGTGEGP